MKQGQEDVGMVSWGWWVWCRGDGGYGGVECWVWWGGAGGYGGVGLLGMVVWGRSICWCGVGGVRLVGMW